MVTENIDIVVRERGARVVRRRIEDIGGSADRASRGVNALRNTLFILGGAGILSSLQRTLDTLTNFENRLRLVTNSTAELNAVQAELFALSNRTRSSFEGSAEVYTRTALAVKDLGISQRETLQFTESLNQAVILSGANTVEATAGLIQLSQALASNRLSGDEFRSVAEQLPFVLDIIAKELGVTRGELRQLSQEGEITGEVILRSFRNARVELNDLFAQTIPTIGQAFQVFRNNLLETLDRLDDFTGASAAVARAIISVSGSLEFLVSVVIAAGAAFAAFKLATFTRSALDAVAANINLAKSVAEGNTTLLTSVEIEKAKAASSLTSARATAASTSAKLADIKATNAQLAQNAALLQVQRTQAIQQVQLQQGIADSTGRTSGLTAARAQLNNTTKGLIVTQRALRASSAELTTATAANNVAVNSLTAAQSRLSAATAASNTFINRLNRANPALGLLIGSLGRLVSLLGGPLNVALTGVLALFLLWPRRSEVIEIANREVEKSVSDLSSAYQQLNQDISLLNEETVNLSQTQILVQLEKQNRLVRQELSGLIGDLTKLSQRIDPFSSEFGQLSNSITPLIEGLKSGSLTINEVISSLDNLGETADTRTREFIAGIIESSRSLENLQEGSESLEAILAVLNGTASQSQRELLGIGESSNTAASGVRNLGTAALGTINALRTLRDFIPELSRAQSIQNDLSEAQNAFQIGQERLKQRLDSGVISIDQYTSSVTELEETYNRAVREIDGTADATRKAERALDDYTSESTLRALDNRNRALEIERRRYVEIRQSLIDANASQADLNSLTEQYQRRLEQINSNFDSQEAAGGGGSSDSVSDPLKRQINLLREIIGPAEDYQLTIQTLNSLLEQGRINQDQFTDSFRNVRIKFLESQTDIASGFERGFLRAIDSATDFASKAESIVTTAFDGMADALADFVTTGKLDFGSLIQDINRQIVRLVISQAFQQLFGGVTGGTNGGNIFSGLFQGLKGILGLQRGGSFVVGSNSGVPIPGNDNRLVALRLQDGEQVDVTPRGGTPGGGVNQNINVTFNVQTPDVEGFRASEAQLSARAARVIAQGQRNL